MGTRKVYLDVTIKGKMIFEIDKETSVNDKMDELLDGVIPEMDDMVYNYVITDSK